MKYRILYVLLVIPISLISAVLFIPGALIGYIGSPITTLVFSIYNYIKYGENWDYILKYKKGWLEKLRCKRPWDMSYLEYFYDKISLSIVPFYILTWLKEKGEE